MRTTAYQRWLVKLQVLGELQHHFESVERTRHSELGLHQQSMWHQVQLLYPFHRSAPSDNSADGKTVRLNLDIVKNIDCSHCCILALQ
jgi:hypothetical protein